MRSGNAIPRYVSLLLIGFLFLSACGGGSGGGGGGGGDPTPLVFTNFQPAMVVVGQVGFASQDINMGGSASDVTIFAGYGSSAEGSWWYSDSGNNRVLGFIDLPTTNGEAAAVVLGQPNFSTTTSATTATGMNMPGGLSIEGGRLAVADAHNHRVLIWNTLPATSTVPADVVVGQPNFTTKVPDTTQTGLRYPLGAFLAGGHLFVLDSANHRLLIYNSVPTTSGAAADVVLGQPDFTSGLEGPLATGMNDPSGLWSDGQQIVVADGNNRVLIWNSIPTAHNTPADVVVGQPDLTTATGGAGPQGLEFPQDVWSNGLQLFVADTGNNRVLVYTPFPMAHYAASTSVLGQSDFAHTTEDDDDQDGTPDATPSERTLDRPVGIALFGNRLVVSDSRNNRVLIYEGH